MFNQCGGHVLFGVTPQGAIVSHTIGDRTIEDVSADIQRIDPPVFPEIERIQISSNREVIAVRVTPGSSPPYRYRSVAYRRVANTTLSMSVAEHNRMLFEHMQRIDEPLYPPLATREALANALCHRDYALGGGSIGLAVYDDRLEVTSTGPLHFGLTPDDLFGPHESRPWNPLIARTFYRRGIIEEWGRGTIKMADLATSMGLPRPEIEERGDCVTVRFRRKDAVSIRQAGGGLTKPQHTVLALLRRSDAGLALREIRPLLDERLSVPQIRRCLAALKAKGLARSTGHDRGARWKAT